MKRILNYSLLLIALLVPVTMTSAQDKKNEQKVKVVISDGSGTRTIIDTIYKDGTMPEKITTKDGQVIIIGKPGDDFMMKSKGEGEKNVMVTVTDDSGDRKESQSKVIVIKDGKSEGGTTFTTAGDGQVYVLTRSGSPDKNVMIASSGGNVTHAESANGEKVFVISDAKGTGKEETYTVTVSSDKDTNADVSKYVIAKDGLVITVEGNDEAKAKEIIQMISAKLGVKDDVSDKQEVKKEETKKNVKKN